MYYQNYHLVSNYAINPPMVTESLTIRYRCKHCGHVLYEFKGVGQSYIGVPTPMEVAKLIGYICPSCKKALDIPSNFRDSIIVRISASGKRAQIRDLISNPTISSQGVKQLVPD